jgi:hypothetical protein
VRAGLQAQPGGVVPYDDGELPPPTPWNTPGLAVGNMVLPDEMTIAKCGLRRLTQLTQLPLPLEPEPEPEPEPVRNWPKTDPHGHALDLELTLIG